MALTTANRTVISAVLKFRSSISFSTNYKSDSCTTYKILLTINQRMEPISTDPDNSHYNNNNFYDHFFRDDENIQAKIKPILNQIHESRVNVKELHTQYGILFNEMINSYRNRLEELNNQYEKLLLELQTKQNEILELCDEVLRN